ncbi:hypothetical protein K435DRAFT_754590 [Dendrothele bispora CBS 962.96]|uniref:F-box domain-containing protein n=1 Tax=Dendrothele bispora (strain CBS 962.96) TaxID=1314807 RepID=A0A4S8M4C9_DENBC|nr:hypothetical protein K435DRAFT_754590 [Dendrothele bispora CBS 962.96]
MQPSLENLLCHSSRTVEQSESKYSAQPMIVDSPLVEKSTDTGSRNSKRKQEEDEHVVDGPSHTKKVKRGNPRRGKLYMLMDMPMDILYEIFGHLEPYDVLRLARTSKPLRNFLMDRSQSISVWRAARSNVGLPSPLDSMSEPAFADLVFNGQCHNCECMMRQSENILWMFATRLCNNCRSRLLRPVWSILVSHNLTTKVDDLKLDKCLPTEQGRLFMVSMVEKHLEEYAKAISTSQDLDSWFAEKIARMTARRESVKLYEEWVRFRARERIRERENTRERRKAAILRKLAVLGWQEEIDNLSPRGDFHSHPFVREPKELTDRIWMRIQDPLIDLMKQVKNVRMHQIYRPRYEVLRKMYPIYCNQQHPDILLPNLIDIIGFQSVKQIAERPLVQDESPPPDNIFDFLITELPNISRTWYQAKSNELVSIAARDIPDFQLSDLSLATTVFKCTAAKCREKLLTFPSVLTHACTHSYCFKRTTSQELRGDHGWFGSSPWNHGGDRIVYDSDGAQIIRKFVETISLDPRNVTVEHMNEFRTIVECLTCKEADARAVVVQHKGQQKFMSWMHAVCFFSSFVYSSLPPLVLVLLCFSI